ncbi:hypothetical protein CEXT_285151 [Caerostris extrusa]|uniref:Uncharacterized protein n=1 Tax=Caerostris extrusa TaxID=172846 RepID=A0AAV4V9B2_CAEEX|nr:hypothetical protein CEXT_285151 [Caerostris extrusa]
MFHWLYLIVNNQVKNDQSKLQYGQKTNLFGQLHCILIPNAIADLLEPCEPFTNEGKEPSEMSLFLIAHTGSCWNQSMIKYPNLRD